jgi:broad specificity phosphatase PhoE
MPIGYDLARIAIEFISTIKRGDVEWQQQKLKEVTELRKQRQISEAEIKHELELLQIKFSEEIKRVQERESSITRDYKDFLQQIDDMKQKIVQTFPDMPIPIALIIHSHAKRLLDDMWRNSDERMRELYTTKLAEFMMLVYDDTQYILTNKDQPKFPTKTMHMLLGKAS